MRVRSLLLAVGLLIFPMGGPIGRPSAAERMVAVRSYPVTLTELGETRRGKLEFLGGVEFSAIDVDFGGFSGLILSPDGQQALAITDRGQWLRFELRHDGLGRLTGIGAAVLAPILGLFGDPVEGHWSDAEGIATDANGREVVISFENYHRLWVYDLARDGLAAHAGPVMTPAEVVGLKRNNGIEALARDPLGALVLVAEDGFPGEDAELGFPAWRVEPDHGHLLGYPQRAGNITLFRIARLGQFRPTDAKFGPDGLFYLLERRFTWVGGFAMRIRRFNLDHLGAEPLEGEELIRLEAGDTVDNMEGLAIHRSEGGETLLYVVSDDNFNPLQRNLLLQFRLRE